MEGRGQIGGGQDQGDGVVDEVCAALAEKHVRAARLTHATYIASSGAAAQAAGGIT